MASRDIIKPYFETGDQPTQSQFWQLFDLVRFLDDPITLAQVTGLVDALNGRVSTADYEGQLVNVDSPYTLTIPSGTMLEQIIPYYGSAGALQLSKVTMGDTDIADKDDVSAGWNDPILLNLFAPVNTNIYIDGIPAGSKLVILKRKIKMT